MTDVITHNQIMVEIKASLNHILHSLSELSTRINKRSHTPSVQPINAQAPLSLPPPSNLTTPSISPSKPTLPSSYPIKRLTYSKMQQLRDQGLCLNCNDIDTHGHRCPVKRILLVLPDEDPNIEQQSREIHAPTVPEKLSSQDISVHAVNHASDLEAMRLSTLFNDHQATSLTVKNGKCMENKGLCSKNYKSFLMGLIQYGTSSVVHTVIDFGVAMMRNHCLESLMDRVECKIKTIESKVLIFDPGGISHGKQHIRSSTLRTRSILKGYAMIRTAVAPWTVNTRPK